MNNLSIQVQNLGKAYKNYKTRWHRLCEWVLPFFGKKHIKKWVLQDINFEIEKGQALGIIGMNGAGKSTLLKLITGTTQQTIGEVKMYGKVAALLELGMGFHPDFTGRENAFMAGQLLGYTYDEIAKLMSQIESFAEIGEYIDKPIRVYSSGMQMRLAFSVATAIRPDILIIDEALSVGDAYFQHKSFDRIREYKNLGTTLLFVSHDKGAVQAICDRAILLNKGQIVMQGKPEAVMDYYNAILADKQNQNQTVIQKITDNGIATISGTKEAIVEDIYLVDSNNQKIEAINVGQKIKLCILVKINSFIERLILGYGIKDRFGQVMYGTNTHLTKQPISNLNQGALVNYIIEFEVNLGVGSYSVQTALVSSDTHLVNNYEWRDLALVFNVINIDKLHFSGCNWLEPTIKIEQI